MLARRLSYLFLDTGCMYRAVTLAALEQGVSISDEIGVTHLAGRLEMEILPVLTEHDGRLYTVILDGKDVTWSLRSAEVDVNVSQVSTYSGVRSDLVRRQRSIGERGKVVMVGRDIGTVVLPAAPLKLYITASKEERARRRWKELAAGQRDASYEQILAEIERRDQIDGNRDVAPMKPAPDAIIVDTTGRSPQEVLEIIMRLKAFQGAS